MCSVYALCTPALLGAYCGHVRIEQCCFEVIIVWRLRLILCWVSGIECLVTASVPTVKGGSVNEMTLLKSGRLAEIAEENNLPMLNMIQSVRWRLRKEEGQMLGRCRRQLESRAVEHSRRLEHGGMRTQAIGTQGEARVSSWR